MKLNFVVQKSFKRVNVFESFCIFIFITITNCTTTHIFYTIKKLMIVSIEILTVIRLIEI
jgi:hypothetical protein